MPKKKLKRKAQNVALASQSESSGSLLKKRVIKWASISVILAILLSVMIAAISASPSSAVTPSAACALQDTDGDAIMNDVDSDIDGDQIANGLDSDIDGDGITNEKDTDPAATLCFDTGTLPIMPAPVSGDAKTDDEGNLLVRIIGIVVVAGLGFGYLVLRRIRGKKK